ncbi:RusA family crossover junction endodeoxyribonuclease [uncultured Ruminococcus sp.]|uniref:RusA family crossover junction endodeoxyribonuclease n=1 Tax=uncultured Ruminococcus sp. TaxID=165186 RepID=UPI0029319411|nr:RusA family crossover junction endodeoxyribonuclease [uncultured Ruminococcus sp.]
MKIEFFLPMIPPSHTYQQGSRTAVRKGKVIRYQDEQLRDVKAKFTAYLGKHIPERQMVGAIRLVTKWCYPIIGNHRNGEYKTSKPDTENSLKLFKDVMTELNYWIDDAQVASEITEKFWADIPGIFVSVEELPSNGY